LKQPLLALARQGWRVPAVGRAAERGAQVAAKAPGKIEFLPPLLRPDVDEHLAHRPLFSGGVRLGGLLEGVVV
jgi:hypothetical protein